MSRGTQFATRLRPATVAVHDDGDMLRDRRIAHCGRSTGHGVTAYGTRAVLTSSAILFPWPPPLHRPWPHIDPSPSAHRSRSEESGVGKERVSTCRSWWRP